MDDHQHTPGTDNDPQKVLSACVLIERLCAQIYLALAEAHSAEPELYALWKKTADEETNHAEQIGMALRVRKGLVVDTRIDMDKVDQAVALVRTTLRDVVAHPPSAVEGLRLALSIESRLADFHLDEVAVFAEPSMKSLFRAMQAADRQHVESIRAALLRRDPGAMP